MEEIENYTKEKLTVNLVWANFFALLLAIPVGLIFWLPFELIWNPEIGIRQIFGDVSYPLKLLLFLVFFIVGVILHELLHGITWSLFAKDGFKSVKFGVLWNMLTPYCHCKEPLQVKPYILGALAPCVILGIIPSIIALITGSFGLLCFGMLYIIVACGDILIVFKVRKLKSTDLVYDHPTEAGCYVYRKDE